MKVVLFCGGLGTRLREHSDTIPKPLVNVGIRPLIWHLMRYYAHFGHKEFILCLGYRGDLIRDYFINYKEYLSNDFTLSEGGRRLELHSTDIHDWRITFVDTGLHANIGQRLLRVRKHLNGEGVFLANYADGLSDIPLDQMIADFEAKAAVASFAGVYGWHTFHTVAATQDGWATHIGANSQSEFLINGGFFVLSERLPCDLTNEAVILVAVEPVVRQHKVGVDRSLHALKLGLHCGEVGWQQAVWQFTDTNFPSRRRFHKLLCRASRLGSARGA